MINRTIPAQWQAYVAQSSTREIANKRLSEVPESMRDEVRRHVETYFKLRGENR